MKKKSAKNVSHIAASDLDELPDYNGVDTTLHEHDDSLLSDGGNDKQFFFLFLTFVFSRIESDFIEWKLNKSKNQKEKKIQ